MNLIIIIFSIAVTLYVIAESYTIISGYIAEWKLDKEEKKRINSDLHCFKLKQLYFYCKSYYIFCGYSPKKAEYLAINAVIDIDRNELTDEKYRLIKGVSDDRRRNQSRCK